jgi:hypothetical protein
MVPNYVWARIKSEVSLPFSFACGYVHYFLCDLEFAICVFYLFDIDAGHYVQP